MFPGPFYWRLEHVHNDSDVNPTVVTPIFDKQYTPTAGTSKLNTNGKAGMILKRKRETNLFVLFRRMAPRF